MAGSLARARSALGSRDFRRLLATRLTSQFGDGLFQAYLIAELVFLDPERQGTAIGIAKAFAILIVPFSLLGPFAGVLIDRWSRRAILVGTPAIRLAAAVALIVVGHSDAPLFALALVIVSANRFFLTTAGAVTPSLVPSEHLLVANSMAAVGGTTITFAGLFSGTQMAEATGATMLLVLSASCWGLAAVPAATISGSMRAPAPGAALAAGVRRIAAELRSGVRRLGATPPALAAIVSMTLDQLLVGFVTVMGVVVFKEELNEGLASYGRLLGAGGLGVLVGTVTAGALESRMSKSRIIALAFAIAGMASLAASAAPRGPTLLVMSFAIGLTFAWRKISSDTIVQQAVPDRFRGRVFAVYDIAYSMARVLAAALAIPLLPRLSTSWLLALAGVVYLGWTPVLPWWIRRPRLVELRFYAGSRADEVPRSLVTGGEEENVELVRSWNEQRRGHRVRRLRVRTAGGAVLDVVSEPGNDRWRVEREDASPEPARS